MMPTLTVAAGAMLSPLAVDLALSRLSIAAVKILRSLTLDDEDIAAANNLRRHFKSYIVRLTPGTPISATMIPEESIRGALEETLSSLTEVALTQVEYDRDVLDDVLKTLEKLSARQRIDLDEAARLLNSVERIETPTRRDEALPTLSDIGDLTHGN